MILSATFVVAILVFQARAIRACASRPAFVFPAHLPAIPFDVRDGAETVNLRAFISAIRPAVFTSTPFDTVAPSVEPEDGARTCETIWGVLREKFAEKIR